MLGRVKQEKSNALLHDMKYTRLKCYGVCFDFSVFKKWQHSIRIPGLGMEKYPSERGRRSIGIIEATLQWLISAGAYESGCHFLRFYSDLV